MSGAPTEAEIQTQWKNAVALLESVRAHVDTNVVGGGGLIDTLVQSLEGEYTALALPSAAEGMRELLSAALSPQTASSLLVPILQEYGKLISQQTGSGFGGSYDNPAAIVRALYEYFVDNSITVEDRAITYDTTPTAGASNVGNGTISRLTEDENGFDLQNCFIETKKFRCREDVNTGVRANAEVFEMLGEASSKDALDLANFGSGRLNQTFITSKHAGTAGGGSLLDNSSFSTYDAAATPKFSGWTESAGGANIAQDTTNFYRTFPNATTDASLRINGGSGTVTLKQGLSSLRIQALDPETPYFFRVMVNPTIGTAVGGNLVIRMGSQSTTLAVASMAGGWEEVTIAFDSSCWYRNFSEAVFDLEIEWASSTSGYLLIDDAIFAPWDNIDGTYWCARGNAASHTPWQIDDILTFTDTGGAPATAKLQYWLWQSGFGYLPSSGTPTIADPT